MTRVLVTVVVGLLTLVAAGAGYRFVRADVEAAVYRERLARVAQDYEHLRERYNEAVRQSAVTELLVEDGRIDLRIRTAAGAVREIPTPFDPSRELFVDFVVRDGRVLIRRVFDDRTPPGEGLVLDEELEVIDWDDPSFSRGQTAYRRFEEGRWVVALTGSGAFALRRVGPVDDVELVSGPQINEYEQLERETRDELRSLTAVDVLRRFFAGE
ncbi:MAG: hypothetical protein ACTS27_02285 [Phycisphaerales bacterium]